ncbi:MAG: PQQ-binding-like beta-propeller repeat protein [Kordiimonadaceae bacterium]|nr:PQQ-binding-like beta-propeller repeat protein [Kordiimonadaceae bacterium]
MTYFKNTRATIFILITVIITQIVNAKAPDTSNGEWPYYTGDIKGSRYSPLDQINADNFDDLELVWSFSTKNLGSRPEYKLEVTPLMIDGVLYATAGTRRTAIALDGKTGELMWLHSMREGLRAGLAPRQLSGRGLSYWSDGKGDDRIYYVTTGYKLVALNAHTGIPIKSFGPDGNGILDLKLGVVQGNEVQIDLVSGEIGLHATPTIAGDLIIVGSAMKEGMTIDNYNNTKGLVRAFDVRTGKKIWQFDPIPRPGQLGNDTWLDNSWERNGNTGVWTQITVDEENGLVFLPIESPSSDFYGGHRLGNNLFGESLVAVDLKTGKYKWHFQVVHHPIWDHDLSSAPLIMDVKIDGKDRKIIALPTKQSFIYAFDRLTGEPIWPIPEKEVPQGNVPGEWYSPTQPEPPMDLMYGRGKLKLPDDLIDFTPELRQAALDKMDRWDWSNGGRYNPPLLGDVNGVLGAINIGATGGGSSWPGASFDPETGIVYAQAQAASLDNLSLAPPPKGFSNVRYMAGRKGEPFRMRYASGTGQNPDAPKLESEYEDPEAPLVKIPGLDVEGLSILKPPYGVLAAIDMKAGKVKWQVPHGETPDNVRFHPKLRDMDIPRTGQKIEIGLVVTKTLVILADQIVTNPGDRERGAMLRAYNKETGEEVGAIWMPAGQTGSPMTYMIDGKQYICVSVSGGSYPGEFRVYALPDD